MITIERPCEERWDAMEGDARMRFCRVCEHHVFDLSQMTAAEASQLITLTHGRACVRLYPRADGTVVTADDCAPHRARARRRRWLRRAAVATAVGGTMTAIVTAGLLAEPYAPLDPMRIAHERELASGIRDGWVMGRVGTEPGRVEPVWVSPESGPALEPAERSSPSERAVRGRGSVSSGTAPERR